VRQRKRAIYFWGVLSGSAILLLAVVAVSIARRALIQDEEDRLLLSAVHHGDIASARRALSRGANVNVRDNPHHKVGLLQILIKPFYPLSPARVYPSALMVAVDRNDLNMVRLLLDNGVRTEQADGTGRTPLRFAAGTGKVDILDLLLTHHANSNSRDQDGMSVLMAAVENEDLVAMQRLIRAGADVNARNLKGRTALMYAARRNGPDPAVVRYLLAHGADVNAKDNEGKTAEDLVWYLSVGEQERKIIQMLKRAEQH
jgi:ankyrin repeat protein